MEFISEFTIADLAILVTLAGGVLAGFQQGTLRYILNSIVVVAAFVLASVLLNPMASFVNSFWNFGTAEQQKLWIYVVLAGAGIIGGFFIVRLFYRQTRLPIVRQVDEIGGAMLGVLWVALIYTVSLLVLDSFFLTASEQSIALATVLGPIYEALNQSVILGWFRDILTPIIGFIARPFVPPEIDALFP